MKTNIRRFVAGAILAAAPLIPVLVPAVAHAATITWTGGGADSNWSTAANWQGGVAPVSSDAVVIDLSATNGSATTDDIAGLGLAGLTFKNNAGGATASLTLAQNLTLSGPVTIDGTDTATDVTIVDDGSARTIALGADVTMTSGTMALNVGSVGDSLVLNGHNLIFSTTSMPVSTPGITANITGSGTVAYNAASNGVLSVSGTNTYSGTTQVLAGQIKNTNPTVFGTSSVSITKGAIVSFYSNADVTINNAIAIDGVSSGSPSESLNFVSLASGKITYTVPNITLNGDTAFDGDVNTVAVNLAGITANGHCVAYEGAGSSVSDGPSNGFLNGPTGCSAGVSGTGGSAATPAADAPKTPNTGFKLIAANPVQTLAVSAVAFLALAGIAYKVRTSSARR